MLKFNPERQLELRTNHQQQLETILAIHNPTNMPAPFKVSHPLFRLNPPDHRSLSLNRQSAMFFLFRKQM